MTRILGSSGRDVAYGSEGNDSVGGGHGADLLDGGSGADELRGGPQADAIYGGTGDDLLVSANGGIDHVFGEGGIDTCRVDALDVVESCEVIDLVPWLVARVRPINRPSGRGSAAPGGWGERVQRCRERDPKRG